MQQKQNSLMNKSQIDIFECECGCSFNSNKRLLEHKKWLCVVDLKYS